MLIAVTKIILPFPHPSRENTKDPQKNGSKNEKKGSKQEPPFLGHKLNFDGGEYSKHPPEKDHPCFTKKTFAKFCPIFCEKYAITLSTP